MLIQLYTPEDFDHELRAQVEAAGGYAQWAQQRGISASHIRDVLKGRSRAGSKVIKAAGFARTSIWKFGLKAVRYRKLSHQQGARA